MVQHSSQAKPKKGGQPTRPNPKAYSTKGKEKEISDRAQVHLNPEGFYEVDVQYSHLAAIGEGCGVKTGSVIQALTDDNLQRLSDPIQTFKDMEVDQAGPDLGLDFEEELDSEEELDLV